MCGAASLSNGILTGSYPNDSRVAAPTLFHLDALALTKFCPFYASFTCRALILESRQKPAGSVSLIFTELPGPKFGREQFINLF